MSGIGFIGLGNMGGAIAEALLDLKAPLHVCDIDPAKLAAFERLGAVSCTSPRDLANCVETVITCLPTIGASASIREGALGLREGIRIRNVIEMSTVGRKAVVEQAARLAEKGIRTLDAPVSGGSAAVGNGSLLILAGGALDHFRSVRHILERISPRILHVGESVGDGQAMKIVNNLLAAANMAASFEALLVGVKLGLRPSAMVEAISQGSGANTGFADRKIRAIVSRRFDYGPRLAIMRKDVEIAFQEATDAGFPVSRLRALGGMAALWQAAEERGLGEQDITRLATLLEDEAGVIAQEDAPEI